jgi:hypothetical protein
VPPDTIYGVQLFENNLQTAVLNGAAAAGARFARLRVLWSYVEPENTSPPTYYWSGPDEAVAKLVQHGLVGVLNLYGNPGWAATTSCGPVDRVPVSRFGDFVNAVVERYDGDGAGDASGSPRIAYWEISNEADFDLDHAGGEKDYGSCFGGEPAAFGAYMRAAYLGAKSADPTAVVLLGGVAYDRFYNKSGYSPTGPFDYALVKNTLDWLHSHYGGEAAWPFFDWIGLHVYNDFRNNWDQTQPYSQEVLGKIQHFKNNQLLHVGQYDLRGKPVAVTEASLASMPSDDWTTRSERIQSAYPGQLLGRARSAGVPMVIWYLIEDNRSGDCGNPYDWMGLGLLRSLPVYQAAQACPVNPIPDYEVQADHEPKPARTAYAVAVDQLAGAAYDRQLTAQETGSFQVEAYRFVRPDGIRAILAFTDNGERLGRIGSPPVEASVTFDASVLPDWTGTLAITDELGNTRYESGSSVTVVVTQWPVYVRPY